MSAPKLKLYYFQARGRAELTRLVLAASNVDYEDIRYTQEQWAEHRKDSPTGLLPMVDTGDKSQGLLTQSLAIARYFAKKAGFMGSTDWEYYLIERAVSQLDEVFLEMAKIQFAPKDKKAELIKEFQDGKGRKLLNELVGFLKQAGGAHFSGKSLSLADLHCVNIVDHLQMKMPDFLTEFPELADLRKRIVDGNPKLAEHIKNRPHTEA